MSEVKKSFFVRTNNRIIKIKLEELCAIEAQGDYVRIVTLYSSHVVHATLSRISKVLPVGDFVRIHNSYVVCLDKISSIEGGSAYVNGKLYNIGREGKKDLMERITVL